MKVKTRFGVLVASMALCGAVLVGCGSDPAPTPPPPSTYHVVCTSDAAKYTVNGLADSYAAGANVAFTITENDPTNYKVTGVTSTQVSVTTVSALSYSFTMPETDVSLTVVTKEVAKYSISVPEDIIVGQPAKVTVKLGDSEVMDLKIEKLASETKSCTIASPKITFNEPGEFHFKLTDCDGTQEVVVSEDYTITARNPEKGETPALPFSASEAYAEALKLEPDTPSAKAYYVEGVVTSISFYPNKSGGTGSFYMEAGENDLEVYKATFTAAQAEDLDIGSKVMVHASLKKHSNKGGTDSGEIYSIDNSTPVKLLADSTSAILRQAGEEADVKFRIAPRGSSEQAITFESSDPSVATVDARGVIKAVSEGSATVTAKSAGYEDVVVSVLVSYSIHAGTEDDPLTADDAILMCGALSEGSKSAQKYYISGAVKRVKEHHHDGYKSTTFYLAGSEKEFYCYHVSTTVEQDSAIDKGSVVKVLAKLYNYGGTLETDSASLAAGPDNSTISLIELVKTKLEISAQDEDYDLTGFGATYPANINGGVITWESENTDVFTIVENKIHPVAEGSARLVATCGTAHAYCLVKVVPVRSINMAESLEAGVDYVLATPLSSGDVFCQNKMAEGGAKFYISGSESLDDAAAARVAIGSEEDYKYTISLTSNEVTKVLGVAMNETTKDGTTTKHYNLGFVGDVVPDTEVAYSEAKFKFTADYRLEVVVDGEVFEVGTQEGKTTFSLGKPSEHKVVASHLYTIGGAVPATAVAVEPASKTIAIGEAVSLKATLTPDNSTDFVNWSTSDSAIATVDNDGKVTGVAQGTATITATATSGVTGTCAITVSDETIDYGTLENPLTPEKAVALLDKLGDNVKSPQKMFVRGVVSQNDAMGKNGRVVWLKSSDGATAKYFELYNSKDGELTLPQEKNALADYTVIATGWGVKYVGSSTTYEFTNKDLEDNYDNPIIVAATAPEVPELERVDISGAKTVKEGSKITLTAAPYPARAEMGTVTWTSSDPTVATVDSATGEVTGVKASETPVTITATESSLGKTGTYQVTVTAGGVPTEQTVTITPNAFEAVDGGSSGKDIGGVSGDVSITAVGTNTASEFRVFKNKVMTVSVTGGKISKIVITCTANGTTKQGPGCWGEGAPEGYTYETDGKVGTWEGDLESVVFTAKDNQVRIVSFVITYVL